MYYYHTYILTGEKVMTILKPISENTKNSKVKKIFNEIKVIRKIDKVPNFLENDCKRSQYFRTNMEFFTTSYARRASKCII